MAENAFARYSGDTPPRELQLRRSAPPHHAPHLPGPSDLRRTTEIRSGYRLVLGRVIAIQRPGSKEPVWPVFFFLKRPPVLLKSIRSPILFKNNYAEVLFLAFDPLSFFKIEPAVQHLVFCTLALRFNG